MTGPAGENFANVALSSPNAIPATSTCFRTLKLLFAIWLDRTRTQILSIPVPIRRLALLVLDKNQQPCSVWSQVFGLFRSYDVSGAASGNVVKLAQGSMHERLSGD